MPDQIETRPWSDQLATDERSYRSQLEYLVANSALYRDKLGAAGFGSAAAAGGLA